jgi:hypothetical protein
MDSRKVVDVDKRLNNLMQSSSSGFDCKLFSLPSIVNKYIVPISKDLDSSISIQDPHTAMIDQQCLQNIQKLQDVNTNYFLKKYMMGMYIEQLKIQEKSSAILSQ